MRSRSGSSNAIQTFPSQWTNSSVLGFIAEVTRRTTRIPRCRQHRRSLKDAVFIAQDRFSARPSPRETRARRVTAVSLLAGADRSICVRDLCGVDRHARLRIG